MIRVFHHLQIAHSALFRAADQRARRDSGLTTTQLAVLLVLERSDGQPITEIAATLAMGKSSLTGLADRMSERGLVRRRPSGEDGRVTNLYLTPEGKRAARQAKEDTRRYNRALLAPFTAQEQEIIDRFLTHLTDNAQSIINGPERGHD